MPTGLAADLLADVPLFEGVTADALETIAAGARLVRVAMGRRFFEEGAPATAFYVLVSGQVKIAQVSAEGHEVILRLIGPGGAFGGIAPFTGGTEYPVTAAALSRSEAAAWDGATIARLMHAYPPIALNAVRMVAERLHDLQRRHRELMTERVERRVARALLRLAQHAGRRVESGVEIGFPLSRQDLAQMTGTTLFTVSRILSGWHEQGLVHVGRRRVVIRSPHRLVVIAEDLAS
jgi:CRP-like cAMP-binding protein